MCVDGKAVRSVVGGFLYTVDDADEEERVDLIGRRIIKTITIYSLHSGSEVL